MLMEHVVMVKVRGWAGGWKWGWLGGQVAGWVVGGQAIGCMGGEGKRWPGAGAGAEG
jgi:hypothetical protein